MAGTDAGKAIEAMATYLVSNCDAPTLAKEMRRASFELAQYLIKDEDINGSCANEMAGIVYMLQEVADTLHPVE